MKLTKRISLLMAIVMIVTAVMSVMPTMVIAAEPAAVADQVSIYKANADGTKGEVIQQSKKWTDVKSTITGATEDIVVVLEGNLAHSAGTNFTTTKKVYIDGQDKYTIANTVANGFTTSADTNVRNVTFRNMKITDTNTGCFFQWKSAGTLTFDNVDLTATGNVNWGVINMNNTGDNGVKNTQSTINIINGSNFVLKTDTRAGSNSTAGSCIIRGGNGKEGNTGIINITNSVVDATAGVHRSGIYVFGHNTLNLNGATVRSAGITPILTSGSPKINYTGTNTVEDILGFFAKSGAQTAVDTCTASVWVNSGSGFTKVGDYTTWASAISSANAQLANGNVEIRLHGDLKLALKGLSGHEDKAGKVGILGKADSANKLTIVGDSKDIKFSVVNSYHTFHPLSDVEFKNLTITSQVESFIFNNGSNPAKYDITFNNVDILIGNTQNFFMNFMEGTTHGSAADPVNVLFNKVNVRFAPHATAVSLANGFLWLDTRANNYVDIEVVDSNIDLTGSSGNNFLKMAWNSTSKARIANVTVTNSLIVTKGAQAITNIDQIKSFNMDFKSAIGQSDIAGGNSSIGGTMSNINVGNTDGVKITVGGTNYTSWAEAVKAANAATTDVTILLNSHVVVSAETVFDQINKKNITIDGQGQYGILTIGANNMMKIGTSETVMPAHLSGWKLEFRNLKVSSHSTGSFVQLYAPVDVAFENVDFLVSPNQRYCLVNSLYGKNVKDGNGADISSNGITVANVIFKNVTATGKVFAGGVNVYRSGNEGYNNFINLIVDDCDFRLSGASFGSISILANTTANVFIKDSYLSGLGGSGNAYALWVSGTLNKALGDEIPPEGFDANVTTCKFVNTTFDGPKDVAKNLNSKEVNVTDIAPTIENGAEVRLLDPTGLRFITHISADVIANIEQFADAGSIKYGTLVFPTKYLAHGTTFDQVVESVLAGNLASKVLNIPATSKGIEVKDGETIIRAAVTGFRDYQYKIELTAIGYVEYTAYGVTMREYSTSTDGRTVEYVAEQALADVRAGQTIINGVEYNTMVNKDDDYLWALYENGVFTKDPAKAWYSPYTQAQRDALAVYAGLK